MTKPIVLSVNEIFGPTLQGEGITAGHPCFFLRLAGCNLHCTWCDTPYAWDWKRFRSSEEAHPLDLPTVVEKLDSFRARYPNVKRLVVSGGEPMLQQAALLHVLVAVNQWGWQVEIETNGTKLPGIELTQWVTIYNVSPKLPNSGHTLHETIKHPVLNAFLNTGKAVFKFVASSIEDLEVIGGIVNECNLAPVVIMPLGTAHTDLMNHARVLFDGVIERGWVLGSRMQFELFGNTRGI